MAVLEKGVITESGSTKSLFLNPKSNTAKKFIDITNSFQTTTWKEGAGI